MDKIKQGYEVPSTKVIVVRTKYFICASGVGLGAGLGSWNSAGGDPWSGGSGSGGGSGLGGWTDNGGDAWN